jgi:uncharacterized protein YkwD
VRDGGIALVADLSGFERFAPVRAASRRALAVVATAALAIAVVVPAAGALNTGSAKVLELTNDHRVDNGRKALVEYPAMTDVAQAWAEKLAAGGSLAHNPNYSTQIPSGWSAAGENVAMNCGISGGAAYLFTQWKNSSGHNANMLNSKFTHIGVGVATDSRGCTWGVQVFAGYPSGSVSAEDLGIAVDPFNLAPVPVISGSPTAGTLVKATTGSWSPSATLTYRWYRNGVPISGAVYSKYTLKTSDRGTKITVKVTGSKSGFKTTSKTSASIYVKKVFGGTTPTISGTAKAGYTLSASTKNFTPTPTTLTYVWYRNGVVIPGATSSKYKLTSSDKGKKISVKVTAKRDGYSTNSRTSAAKSIAK